MRVLYENQAKGILKKDLNSGNINDALRTVPEVAPRIRNRKVIMGSEGNESLFD